MFTGDLVNKPKNNQLVKFLAHASKINCPWYAINGNHDIAIDGPLTKEEFRKILNCHNRYMSNQKIYYAFTPKKGFRVICLDSIIDYKLTSNGEISNEQLKWLKKELDDHKKDVVILCTHVPIDEPYSSSNHKLNNEDEVKTRLDEFKQHHTTLNTRQMQCLKLVENQLKANNYLKETSLYDRPFTGLGDISDIFTDEELEELYSVLDGYMIKERIVG